MTPSQVTFEIRGTLLPGIVKLYFKSFLKLNEHFNYLEYLRYGVVARVGIIFS